MKQKSINILMILVLVLSLCLVSAIPVLADVVDPPNTPSSSRMVFQGELTADGDGSYTGTIPMVDEAALGIGDGIAGFDIYAKEGAIAMYDKAGSGVTDYAYGPVVDHDMYTTAGGWGDYYDPDCEDWNHYQLTFDGDNWAVEYVSGGTTYAAPMSGTMDWTARYALETGTGAYYGTTGIAESPGFALSGTYGTSTNPAGAWDMDWSWGSEYIPLQFPGFDVYISLQGSDYRVTLMPAAAGTTNLTANVPDIVAITVNPTSIDFGTLLPGTNSAVYNIGVTNIGTHSVTVDVAVDGSAGDLFFDNLYLRHSSGTPPWAAGAAWDDIITSLGMNATQTLQTQLKVPGTYIPNNTETAVLTFTATGD